MSEITTRDYSLKFNRFTTMSRPQVNHVKQVLDKLFKNKIDLSDHHRKLEADKKPIFYSRALAAYYLHIKCGIEIDIACNSITDGYKDNGIDAVYYDEQSNTLHLIQSKLINEGAGEPDNGDMLKFQQGISDIIDENFGGHFNNKILKKEPEIKNALSSYEIKLNIVLAYTGKGFTAINQKTIHGLMKKLNDTMEWAYFTDFNLKSIHYSLSAATSEAPIEHEIALSNWGAIEEPYKTYYGQISAYELASIWQKHGKKLFGENIRSFIGQTAINSEIQRTISDEPENFIYFNNGVTMICNEIDPIPGKTVHKNTGSFFCKGMQIVNGAQTVGTLGISMSNYEEQLKKCAVFIRLIPLNVCPDNFGNRITVASNTQNRIEKRDFVSLDPIQQNLKLELSLDGITYSYKRTDEAITYDERNCSLEEATVSLACFDPDITTCVLAKREMGKLWEDIKREPYTKLFNDQLKATTLWSIIKASRECLKYLNETKSTKLGREKSTYTYGNYFVLNILFKKIPKNKIMEPNKIDNYMKDKNFHNLINNIISVTYNEGEKSYPTSLIHQLYRNATKCKDLEKRVLALC